jgi:hypothetical protein
MRERRAAAMLRCLIDPLELTMNDAALRPDRRVRLASATAAAVVSGALIASLLGLFHQAAPPHWVTASPELMALVERCDDLPPRAGRERCMQQVVALIVEREKRAVELAQR